MPAGQRVYDEDGTELLWVADTATLSGAGTHPVGGVCALPGKLAAQTAIRDHKKR